MARSKQQPRTIIAAQGADWYVTYSRLDGYTLYVNGQIVGGFDRLADAEAARNELAFETMRRAA